MRKTTKLLLRVTMLISATVFSSCTITQKHLDAPTSSVANNTEGGYIGTLGIGDSFEGYVFDKGAVDHYNALISMYGALPQTINNEAIGFVPALKSNDGVRQLADEMTLKIWHLSKPFAIKSDGLYLFDREHAKDYKLMRWWESNGVPRQTFLRSLIQ